MKHIAPDAESKNDEQKNNDGRESSGPRTSSKKKRKRIKSSENEDIEINPKNFQDSDGQTDE
jgi:hypothetical protein